MYDARKLKGKPMRLVLALILSLVVHGLWSQWRTVDEIDAGTAGRAALAIQQMRVVKKVKPKPKPETKEPIVKTEKRVPQSLIAAAPEPEPVEQEILEEEPEEPPVETEQEISPVDYIEGAEIAELEPQPVVEPADNAREPDDLNTKDTLAEYQGVGELPVMERPRYRKASPPKYPRLARKRGYQGTVWVKATVGIDGRVQDVELLASSGFSSLDKSALKTVAEWQFYPYEIDGRLSIASVELPVEFTLTH